MSVKMPYADYAFSKVNMSIKEYESGELDTIIRGISGAPRQTRPLSLPRSTMLEKEDVVLEPEKMVLNKNPEMTEKIETFKDYQAKRVEIQEKLKEIDADLDGFKEIPYSAADIAYFSVHLEAVAK